MVTFIALYVFAERTQTVQRMLSWQFARRTTWIGYGTRIAASIIFPVGMLVDSICGIFSVGVNRWFFGGFPSFHEHAEVTGGEHSIVFIQYLTTTVTQGLLLNIALTGYMLFVFGICHIFAALLGRKAGTFF